MQEFVNLSSRAFYFTISIGHDPTLGFPKDKPMQMKKQVQPPEVKKVDFQNNSFEFEVESAVNKLSKLGPH